MEKRLEDKTKEVEIEHINLDVPKELDPSKQTLDEAIDLWKAYFTGYVTTVLSQWGFKNNNQKENNNTNSNLSSRSLYSQNGEQKAS